MAKIAYLRVSTTHQNTDRQEYAMPADIEKTFIDKASGKDTNRPQFQAMLDYVSRHNVHVKPERVFSLKDVAKAHEYLASSDSFGKVVVLNDK